ncbi:unnamed protein product [Darwinula stevensoni]|uniref:Uncharacterized protein n=1 Tax=Darwinula stevensoni TaxID=69355 RepID=A0A7R9FU02_9CRUS|nr:unnamed protein product [Darwinula stevensoni]CAG0906822.1 unnamed protein product [Darwinula stevensoni]
MQGSAEASSISSRHIRAGLLDALEVHFVPLAAACPRVASFDDVVQTLETHGVALTRLAEFKIGVEE